MIRLATVQKRRLITIVSLFLWALPLLAEASWPGGLDRALPPYPSNGVTVRPNAVDALAEQEAHLTASQRSRSERRHKKDKPAAEAQGEGEKSKRVEQALETIRRGPPYPYRKDGTEFRNAEGRLPRKPRGYYREFTVPPPPGTGNRGAERLIMGKEGEIYYTGDHYGTFKRIK